MSINTFDLTYFVENDIYSMLKHDWEGKSSQQLFEQTNSQQLVSPVMALDEASPGMDTPFLEGSTPYLSSLTNTYQPIDSPYHSPFADIMLTPSNEIFVANYMASKDPTTSPWCHDEPAAFNGDPTELLIDKSKLEEEQVKQSLLFGPIPSSQVSDNTTSLSQFDHQAWTMFPEFDGIDTPSDVPTATQTSDYTYASDNDKADEMDPMDDLNENGDDDLQDESDDETAPSSEDEDEPPAKRATRKQKRTKNQKQCDVKRTTDEKRFPCPVCKRQFGRRYNLKTHIQTHDKNRRKEFKCNSCKSTFDRRHDRERHIETVHRGQRAYTCSDCGAAFSRCDALTRHANKFHDDA